MYELAPLFFYYNFHFLSSLISPLFPNISLFILRLFMEILNSCLDCDEIQFKEDGNWAPMRSKKEVQEVSASYNGIDGKFQSLLIISSYC